MCHTQEGEQYLWNGRGEATKKQMMNFKFHEIIIDNMTKYKTYT